MYYPTDDVSDFQVDAPTFALEGEAKVLALLDDRDFAEGSIEFVSSKLDQGLMDLTELGATNALVQEAIQGRVDQGHALRNAIRLRTRLEKTYGVVPGVFVAESYHYGAGVVLVLEEEDKAEKGFFARIIDSIVKAFKWLWEKIAGLFGGGKKDEEKAKDENEKAKEGIAKMKDGAKVDEAKGMEAMADPLLMSAFGFLGDEVTPEMVMKCLRTNIDLREHLARLFNAAVSSYKLMITYLNNLAAENEVNASQIEELVKTIQGTLESVVTRFPVASRDNMVTAGVISAEHQVVEGKIHVLDGFVRGSALYVWGETAAGGSLLYTAKMRTLTGKKASRVKYPTAAECEEIIHTNLMLVQSEASTLVAMEKEAKDSANKTAELEKILGRLMEKAGDNKEAVNALVTTIRKVGQSIHRVAGSAAFANQSVVAAETAALKYVTRATGSYASVLQVEGGEKKGETA